MDRALGRIGKGISALLHKRREKKRDVCDFPLGPF